MTEGEQTMATCKKCGAQIAESAKFCPICGEVQDQRSDVQNVADEFVNRVQNLNDTPDYTNEIDPADINQNRVMGILAYISWLVLIPIFAAKESRFARFHANQGLVLAIAEAVFGLTELILLLILGRLWVLRLVIRLIFLVPHLFCVVLTILGIVNASRGKAKELPLIGKIRILK